MKRPESKVLQEYWDDMAQKTVESRYSRFGLFLAPYWRLERQLIMKLLLFFLHPIQNDGERILLKTDLWEEGIDSSSWQIYKLLGDTKPFNKVIGVDISPFTCYSAKTRLHAQGLAVACSDVRKLPFRDNTFDAIWDDSTMDHIPSGDIASVINEYSRCLKEGGILVLIFDSETFAWVMNLRKVFNCLRRKEDKVYKFWWRLSPVWVKKELSETGFGVLNELPIGILSASLLWLKILRYSFSAQLARRLLHFIHQAICFTRTSRYFFPLSSQYLYIARKLPNITKTGS